MEPTSLTWTHELRFYVSGCVYYATPCKRVRVVDGPVPRYHYIATGAERWSLRELVDHHTTTSVRGDELVEARAAAVEALALFATAQPTHTLLGVAWPTAARILNDWDRVWLDVRRLELAGALDTWSDDLLALDPGKDPLRVTLLVASCGHIDAALRLARAIVRDELTPVARAWLAWFLDEIPLLAIGALAHDAEETDSRFHPARALPAAVSAALCGHWSEVLATLPPQPGNPGRWGVHRVLDAFARLATPDDEARLRTALEDMFSWLQPFQLPEPTRVGFELVAMLPIIGLYQTHLVPRSAAATIAALGSKLAQPVVESWQPSDEVRDALRELIALFDLAIAQAATVHADPNTAQPFRIWL